MALQPSAARRTPGAVILVLALALLWFSSMVFVSPQVNGGRRAAVLIAGSWLATAGPGIGASSVSAKEITGDQELCLSDCVYQCSGGARGKGDETVPNRKECLSDCKDKCLGKVDDGELILN
eukprot:TRINITY_DN82580_c0_g1_i1.p1 TRINITY_DN82580_c0_g1~~TRINITY_DN82580_c0_g1_i1.p1  ORF type:complete len:122 (+),score=18.79 TRINITY_DN82580_c0_g1_i1:82-447(+)